jgi:hypothetical protein
MTRRPTIKLDLHGLEDDGLADLAREIERLDVLMAPHWPRAMKGDIEAAETVIEIIDRKILLLGPDRAGIRH